MLKIPGFYKLSANQNSANNFFYVGIDKDKAKDDKFYQMIKECGSEYVMTYIRQQEGFIGKAYENGKLTKEFIQNREAAFENLINEYISVTNPNATEEEKNVIWEQCQCDTKLNDDFNENITPPTK